MIVSMEKRTEDGLSLYLRVAARRKFLIGLPIAAGGALAYFVASSQLPHYAAEAMLTLNTRNVQVIDIESVVSRLPQENAVLRTELDALSSRSMAGRVARDLDLVHDPDFLHELSAPRLFWERLTSVLEGQLSKHFDLANGPVDPGDTDEAVARGTANPEPDRAVALSPMEFAAVNWLLEGLEVSNDGRSYTIRVRFTSLSPELSTRVANAFAEAYLADQVELKVKATRDASAWLSRRLEELRHELETSEAAVQRFRREADLLEISGDTMAAQQLVELNSRLIAVRNNRLQLEARLKGISEVGRDGGTDAAFADLLSAPSIDAIRMKVAQAKADAQLLQKDLGPQHPLRVAADSRVALLNEQLAVEIGRARRSLEDKVVAAREEEAELEKLLRTDKGRFGEGGAAIVRLNQLQREAEANRTLYESLLNRYKQTVEQDTLATAEARLISQAVPPGTPSGPRKLPIMLLGLVVGSSIGAALVIIREWLDRSVRRTAEFEEMTGLPVFGVLPRAGRVRARPEETILDKPDSPFSEALRRSLVAFQLSHRSGDVKIILVTSATAGEGKTVFCVAAARALALTGVRVLVVDADLHRPRVAAAFGGKSVAHIGDVVRGRVAFQEAVCQDPRSGARYLAAVPEHGDAQALLELGGFCCADGPGEGKL